MLAGSLAERGIPMEPAAKLGFGPFEERRPWLEGAGAVLVVWSRASVSTPSVLAEAKAAGDRLVLARLTRDTGVPDAFRGGTTIDLRQWNGHPGDRRVDELAEALRETLARSASRVPAEAGEPDFDESAAGPDPGADGPLTGGHSYSRNAAKIIPMATQRSGGLSPDATCLLLAVLSHTRQASPPGVAGRLVDALASRQSGSRSAGDLLDRLEAVFPATLTRTYPDDGRVAPWPLLDDFAANCATRLLGRPQIHTRHLLAAAVLADNPPLEPRLLETLGVSHTELRRMLLDAIRGSVTGESPEVWAAILLGAPERLAGGISADLVDPNQDIPLDQDDLGVGVWASMFATVIADRNTPMPVSIGLFGEWGSGKSYFMGLLRAEIRRLCASGQPAYLSSGDVVQIGFNAWHYADTNLWASLGDEIFRQLADEPATPEQIRAEVRKQIADGREVQDELSDLAGRARQEKERLRDEVAEATRNRQLRAQDLLHAVAKSPELKRQLSRVWRRLGVSDEADQARLLADQLRGAGQDASELRGLIFRRRTWVMVVICLIALLVTVAGVFIPATWGARLRDDGAVTTLALVLTSAVTVAGGISSGLRQLRQVVADLADRADAEADQRSGVALMRTELKAAEAEEDKARAQLKQATAHVAELERRLVELMPGRRLYSFLAERAASGDYASQLGLISIIRKDFESLARLLKDQDEAGDASEPGTGNRKIGRIVLFIDDLDRCRSDQVVDVLQAVHLLLALDLFVVVVGVDPRWLLRSLQDRYRGTLDAGVTPSNYLEKIFNIPFVLPAFPDDRLGDLVRRLAAPARKDGRAATAGSPASAAVAVSGADGTRAESTPSQDTVPREAIPVEPGSEIAEARADTTTSGPAPLTDRELAFLAGLGPFVGTPRDAKRLFNLYRMLRATRDLSPASEFLGDDERPGEFQAVAMLLAMLMADGDLLRRVLDAPRTHHPPVAGGLTWRPAEGIRWHDFVPDLSPQLVGETWENGIVGEIPVPDVPAWQRLAGATTRTQNLVLLADLSAFQRWAPRIRRFSYRLSRKAPD